MGQNGSYFADYLSCNWGRPVIPSSPMCHCQVWADRKIARQHPPLSVCHKRGAPRSKCTWKDDGRSCECHCSQAGANASSRFTGMMPCFMFDDKRQGTWYSHPKVTECTDAEHLGARRVGGG